ncbi:MAG: galactokinase [Chitinophagaceae bacterium]|nr:galactokinase [Chitinophagaceae bacterium]
MTTHQIHASELKREFNRLFSRNPEQLFFCPGRINLIGEHIDYNGGQVLPCAISMGTYLAVAKNNDKRFRFHCLNFPETADLHLQSSYSKTGAEWFNYPLGVVDRILQDGHDLSGLDLLFYGNLPIGAGLSSSASIEVLMGFALSSLFGLDIDKKDIALLAKDAENHFIGVNCGIMDQFAVAMGKKDHAILLNCDNLGYEYIPFKTANYSLLIINTNKQRSLAESKYNERFTECGAALKLLKQELSIQHLCDASLADWEVNRYMVNNPVLEKRATHVISENQRVKDAVIAMQTGDMELFGKLLYASHHSLRYDYEVSGKELDTIVDFCTDYPGCIGARMTGAGFGGCAIALVQENKIEDFSEKLLDHYTQQIGYAPGIFAAAVSEGVCELQITN